MILPNYILNQGKNYILQKVSSRLNFLTPKPSNLIMFLTYNCNLRCRYCQSWKYSNKTKELKISDWKKVILQFKKWVGPYHLTLTGGEPFQSKFIIPLIKFLQNQKNIKTSILTNGSLLNKDLCNKIIDSKIDNITISLNSLNPSIHDFLVRKKGCCNTIKNNITLLKNLGESNKTKIYIATVINKMNLEELPSLVEYTKKTGLQGIKFQMLNFHTVGGKTYDNNWYKKTELWPQDSKKVGKIMKELIKMKKDRLIWNSEKQLKMISHFLKNPDDNKYHCMANRTNLCIDPYGNLGFCELKSKLGSISDQKLKDFWYSKRLKKIREEKCNRTCRYLNSNSNKRILERIEELMTIKG